MIDRNTKTNRSALDVARELGAIQSTLGSRLKPRLVYLRRLYNKIQTISVLD